MKLRVSLHGNVNSKSSTKIKEEDFLVISTHNIINKGLHKGAMPGFYISHRRGFSNQTKRQSLFLSSGSIFPIYTILARRYILASYFIDLLKNNN